MIRGLVFFVLGLLIVAGAVVFIIVSLLGSHPIGLVPGALGALLGIGINFYGLTLIYRAISDSTPKSGEGERETPRLSPQGGPDDGS